jgi:hypothetical protein
MAGEGARTAGSEAIASGSDCVRALLLAMSLSGTFPAHCVAWLRALLADYGPAIEADL